MQSSTIDPNATKSVHVLGCNTFVWGGHSLSRVEEQFLNDNYTYALHFTTSSRAKQISACLLFSEWLHFVRVFVRLTDFILLWVIMSLLIHCIYVSTTLSHHSTQAKKIVKNEVKSERRAVKLTQKLSLQCSTASRVNNSFNL